MWQSAVVASDRPPGKQGGQHPERRQPGRQRSVPGRREQETTQGATGRRPEDEERWLDCGPESFGKVMSILKPFPADLMAAQEISRRMNDPKYDAPTRSLCAKTYHLQGGFKLIARSRSLACFAISRIGQVSPQLNIQRPLNCSLSPRPRVPRVQFPDSTLGGW